MQYLERPIRGALGAKRNLQQHCDCFFCNTEITWLHEIKDWLYLTAINLMMHRDLFFQNEDLHYSTTVIFVHLSCCHFCHFDLCNFCSLTFLSFVTPAPFLLPSLFSFISITRCQIITSQTCIFHFLYQGQSGQVQNWINMPILQKQGWINYKIRYP